MGAGNGQGAANTTQRAAAVSSPQSLATMLAAYRASRGMPQIGVMPTNTASVPTYRTQPRAWAQTPMGIAAQQNAQQAQVREAAQAEQKARAAQAAAAAAASATPKNWVNINGQMVEMPYGFQNID